MDGITAKPTTKISATEMERRRKIVRQAHANNRIEGIYRDAASNEAVEAYVCGDIDVMEMSARLAVLPQSI